MNLVGTQPLFPRLPEQSPLAQSQCIPPKFNLKGSFDNCLANPSQKLHSLPMGPGISLSFSSCPEQTDLRNCNELNLNSQSLTLLARLVVISVHQKMDSLVFAQTLVCSIPDVAAILLILSLPRTASCFLYFSCCNKIWEKVGDITSHGLISLR
ncbi:hypothetical protein BDW72DRAFT_5930 [Aspergillus terricola var. indicus]